MVKIEHCPMCNSTKIGAGKITGYGRMYPLNSWFPSTVSSSRIIATICCDCGYIIEMKVEKPEIFLND